MGWFDKWYEEDSKAFGYTEDIEAGALVFEQIRDAMDEARPQVQTLQNTRNDVWSGRSADEMRTQVDGLPELMRRSGLAHANAATALRLFAPKFDEYVSDFGRLQNDGRNTADDVERHEAMLRSRLRTLDKDDNFFEGIADLFNGASEHRDDAEVSRLLNRIEELESRLDRLKAEFNGNEDEFDDAVRQAVDRLHDADTVLYNNGFDKFWTQTLEPIIDAVRVVLEIAAIVIMIAALLGSGGTLAPLIVAALLVATSAAKIAGTAAAGREVTGEMWLNLAIDLAGLATAGLAHKAAGAKAAASNSRLAAQNNADEAAALLKGKASFNSAQQASTKLAAVDRLNDAAMAADDAAKWFDKAGRVAEVVEGGLTFGEGAGEFAQGNYIEGVAGMAGGVLDVGGVGGAAGSTAKVGAGFVDIGATADFQFMDDANTGIENFALDISEGIGETAKIDSPTLDQILEQPASGAAEPAATEWPGIGEDGSGKGSVQ